MTTNGTLNYSISFAGTNGANIQAGLAQGSDGNLYGVAIDGTGPAARPNSGALFRLTTNGVLSTLLFFGQGDDYVQDGVNPNGSLLQGPDGNFYGGTAVGPGSDGVIYKATTNETVSPLCDFDGADGSAPTGPLMLGPNGNFFGMTQAGGTYGWGTVFQISSNGIFTNVFSFDGTNGLVACGPGPGQEILAGC